MNGLKYYYNILYILSLLAITHAQWINLEESCSTPSGETGDCVTIKKCQPIVDFMAASQPLTQDVINLLRSYQCGFEGNSVKVCCPNGPIKSTPPDVSNHGNLNLLPRTCGILNSGDRIVNGQKTGLFEFPWMALLNYQIGSHTEFKCGATLINDRYILTAAHCLKSKYLLVGVRVGDHDLRTETDCQTINKTRTCAPPYQDLDVEEIIPHPAYNTATFLNDIGLIRVQKMKLQTNVRPICLPLEDSRIYDFTSSNNNKVIVTGWGRTENFTGSPELLKVSLEVFPHDTCKDTYKAATTITEKQLCAGGKAQKDSCSGDSGGPLHTVEFLHGEVRYVQQGVVSFGPKICGIEGRPGVYTRVAYYMKWILDTIRP